MNLVPSRLLVIPAVCSLLVFWPAFDNCFEGDDFVAIRVLMQNGLWESSFQPNNHFPFYRPAAVCQFAGQLELFGLESGWFRAVNWILHLAACLLLFRLACILGYGTRAGALAAGLVLIGFAHYGKMILWATCGPAIFSQLLLILALLSAHKRPATWATRGALLAVLLIAPMFHEIGKLAPFLVLLTMIIREGRSALRQRGILAVAVIAATVWLQALWILRRYYPFYGLIIRLEPAVFDRFIRLFGFSLAPFQSSAFAHSVLSWSTALTPLAKVFHLILGGVVLLSGLILFFRGPRLLRVPIAWCSVVMLASASVPMPSPWLELRYLYFTAFPMATVVGWGLLRLWESRNLRLRITAAATGAFLFASSIAVVRFIERKYDAERWNPDTIAAMCEVRRLMEEKSR